MSNTPWWELAHRELLDPAKIDAGTPAEPVPFTKAFGDEVHQPDDIQPASADAKAACIAMLEAKKARRLAQTKPITKPKGKKS